MSLFWHTLYMAVLNYNNAHLNQWFMSQHDKCSVELYANYT